MRWLHDVLRATAVINVDTARVVHFGRIIVTAEAI